MMGVDWSCFTATNCGTTITNGVLKVAADETAAYVKVTATSLDDPSKSASVTVQIVEPAAQANAGIMTLELDANTLMDAAVVAPDASLMAAPDANGSADITAGAENAVKDDAAEPAASAEPEKKPEDEKQTVGTIPTDDGVSITITETKPAEETGSADGEPAADGEPTVDAEQPVDPAQTGEPEAPAADGAQGEEPKEPEEPAQGDVQPEAPAADGEQSEEPKEPEGETVTSGIVIKNEDGTVAEQRELDEKPAAVEKTDDAKESQAADAGEQEAKAVSSKKSTSSKKSEDEAQPEEELDDESLAELDKQENSIVIKFTKAADKIARGNYSQFTIEVSGADKAGAVWSIVKRKDDLKPISTVCSQDGKVTVGADEKATSFYVKVTVSGTSKYHKVLVVDPEKKNPVDTATTAPATTTPTTVAPDVTSPATSTTQPAADPSEEEMANQAAQEGNYDVDPVLSSF